MKYIIGNWKSNKTINKSREWLDQFIELFKESHSTKVILCPSFIHIPSMAKTLKKKRVLLALGAQNISPYDEGAYTGEVTARQLVGLVNYVLIGHSERRNHFHETDKMLEQKVKQAKNYNIEPIYCVQSDKTPVPQLTKIVAYEPIKAIGTGNSADPTSANNIIRTIKQKHTNIQIGIYGGSVNPDNAFSFLAQSDIDGVLPGGASLDAHEFARIIEYASQGHGKK